MPKLNLARAHQIKGPMGEIFALKGSGYAWWSPASLFAAGEKGVWYDPSDLKTLFQDHLGTIPAAYGQPVGLMLDKSGRGNHASQPTVTARPTLMQDAGGRAHLQFDGVDDKLIFSPVGLGDEYTLIAFSDAGTGRLWSSQVNGNTFQSYNSKYNITLRAGSTVNQRVWDAGAGADRGRNLVIADSAARCWVNYTPATVITASGSLPNDAASFDVLGAATGAQLSGGVFGAIIVKRLLTDGERVAIGSYFGVSS